MKITQSLIKHFDATRITNGDSKRAGGWSTIPEIQDQGAPFVRLKTVSYSTLNQLVREKYVQRKKNLYRVTQAGLLWFYNGPVAAPAGDYTPPEKPPGQNGQDGQNLRGGGIAVPVPMPVSGIAESVIKNLL